MAVTRRHHPLEGQRLEVMLAGKEQLAVRLADGTSMRIPRAWTDADGVSPPPPTPPTALSGDAIRELVALIDALAGRS